MTSRLAGNAKRYRPILTVAGALIFCSLAQATLAQGPIRVETNQVLVPVIVVDGERLHRLWKHPDPVYDAVFLGELNVIASSVLVHDLTPADFQLPDYVVAYTLPKSPEGSCHQIKVRVNRPNALVGARTEYCNTVHSASDPINGTRLGEQLQTVLGSAKEPKVHISLTAMVLRATSGASRVHFALDWPGNSLKAESNRAVLAMVLSKSGSFVARISDLAERAGISDRYVRDWPHYLCQSGCGYELENRYETQFSLPPGEYNLRVALGDGKKFGRAEIPLVVEAFDEKALTMTNFPCVSKLLISLHSGKNLCWLVPGRPSCPEATCPSSARL